MKLDNCISERINKKIYRDGDKCIKLFDEVYSKADVLNEALNHARVEETGLNVPELYEVTRIDGKWAIVSQFIEGESLADLIAANPKKYDEYMEMFEDPACTVPAGQWDKNSDHVYYMLPADLGPGEM